jgi:hypothetical protein
VFADRSSREHLATIGSIVVRVAVLIATVHESIVGPITADLARFRGIFLAPGTPYRSFPVEYAPGELLFIRTLGSSSPAVFATRLAVVAFLADIAAWAAIRWGWGRAPSVAYLILGTPLLVFLYTRFDLVPVAMAAWGAALAVRGRERSAGLTFAAAVLTKLWPIAVIPMLAMQRRRRALRYVFVSTAVGVLVWVVVGGSGAIRQVVTFRGATGWDVGGSVGSVVWIMTGETFKQEQGSPRIGDVPWWGPIILAIVLLVALGAVWWRALGRPIDAPGAASLAAVGALLACSPLYSAQFAAWLLPWAAIASANGHRALVRTTALITVLTATLFLVYTPDHVGRAQVLLIIRNAATIALPVTWLISTRASTADRRVEERASLR